MKLDESSTEYMLEIANRSKEAREQGYVLDLENPLVKALLAELSKKSQYLNEVGLEYLIMRLRKMFGDNLPKGIEYSVVQTLPATGVTGTVYFVPLNSAYQSDKNIYEEYLWVGNKFELLGAVDVSGGKGPWLSQGEVQSLITSALANYVTQTSLNTTLSSYATQTWVNNKGYLTSSSLSGYATQSWVQSQGYLTSSSATGNCALAIALNTSLYGSSALKVGLSSSATGSLSTALGSYSKATGANTIAVGYNANTPGNYSVGVGSPVTVTGIQSVGMGAHSQAVSNYTTAVGAYANAASTSATAFGYSANVTASYATALGASSTAGGTYSTAVGYEAYAYSGNSVSIGRQSEARGIGSVAVGHMASSGDLYSVAIGYSSSAPSPGGIAIGGNVNAGGTATVAIGRNCSAASLNGVAIGHGVQSTGNNTVTIGTSTTLTTSTAGVAVGYNCKAQNTYATAVGQSCNAALSYTLALGYLASATGTNAVAIGRSASAPANAIVLGGTWVTALNCKVAVTATSDERDKTDIEDIRNGAVELMQYLRPIRFRWNDRDRYIPEELTEEQEAIYAKYGLCDYDHEEHAKATKKGDRVRVGLLAQDIPYALNAAYGDKDYADILQDNLYDYDEVPEGVENRLGITYEHLIPFLVKAIQELDDRLHVLEGR